MASTIINEPTQNHNALSQLVQDLKRRVRDLEEQLTRANEHIAYLSSLVPQEGAGENYGTGCPAARLPRSEDSAKPATEPGNDPEPVRPTIGKLRGVANNTQQARVKREGHEEKVVDAVNMVKEMVQANNRLRTRVEEMRKKNLAYKYEIYNVYMRCDKESVAAHRSPGVKGQARVL